MKNFLFLIIFCLFCIYPAFSFAEIEKGKWTFINEADYCLIQSAPVKTDIPEGKLRGEHYIYVYRINKNPDPTVQMTAGYDYKSSESIKVMIDESEYDFWSDSDIPDTAWAKDDKKVIYAMKKGLKLVTQGISSKGTKVIDTYSLNGFTSAYNKLINNC